MINWSKVPIFSPETSSLMVSVCLEKAVTSWKHMGTYFSSSLSKLQLIWALLVCDTRGRGLQKAFITCLLLDLILFFFTAIAPLLCSLCIFSVSSLSVSAGKEEERGHRCQLCCQFVLVYQEQTGAEECTLTGCSNKPLTPQVKGLLQTQHSNEKEKSQLI